jgi:hypothetical protein
MSRSLLITLCALIVSAFGFHYSSNVFSQGGVQKEQQEEATPVQEGVKTPRQREHGKLFKGYGGKKLDELPATPSGDIMIVVEPGLSAVLPGEAPANSLAILSGIGCDADAVILGNPKNKTSQITGDGNFVFSDYEVTVGRVLKDNSASPIQVGSSIIVTKDGGTIKYKGRTITAINRGFRSFEMGGQYLLFLKYLPASNSYQAFSNGSFHLQGDKVTRSGGDAQLLESGKSAATFMSEVEAAVAASCVEPSTSYKLQ